MRFQEVDFLGGFYADDSLLWSSQDVVNWLPTVAKQKGARSAVQLKTPPGLSYFTQCGEGPIRGARDVEGKLFVVSGTELYEIALNGTPTLRGVVPGSGLVSMAHNKRGYGNQLLIVNGDAGYVWDTSASTFTKITDSGYPGAVIADYLDHYLIQVDPWGRFWFNSDLDDALSYNTLDQQDAEAAPDKLKAIAANQLEAVVFGERTVEFFSNTGAATNTFQSKRIVIERGIAGRYTLVKLDNTLMWLGNDGIFYRLNGYGAQPVSVDVISRAIAGLDWERAFGFTWEDKGYKVAYWTFPDGQTWGYDVTQPPGYQWHRRESFGISRWRLNTCTKWQGQWIGGDYRTGALFRVDWSAPHEVGMPLVSERTGPTASANQNAVVCPYIEFLFDTTGEDWDGVTGLPPTLSITGDLLPSGGTVGEVVDFDYTIAGGVGPYVVSLASGSLPGGLSLSSSGNVSGTLTTAGEFSWSVQVTDALESTDTHNDDAEVAVPNLFVAIDNTLTLKKSTDGGATFPDTVTTGLTDITSEIYVGAAGGKIFHFGTDSEGRVSDDGASFSGCTGLPFDAGIGNLIHINNEWQAYIDSGNLYVSANGTAFAQRTISSGAINLASMPAVMGARVLCLAAGNRVNLSTDSGATFTEEQIAAFNSFEGINRILAVETFRFILFGRAAGSGDMLIGRSFDGSPGSWTTAAGPATAVVHGVAFDPDAYRIVIVLQTGDTWYSDDEGGSWTAGAAVPYGGAGAFPPVQTNNMIFSGGYFYFCAAQGSGVNRIYRSPDGVTAWAQVFQASPTGNAIHSMCEFVP